MIFRILFFLIIISGTLSCASKISSANSRKIDSFSSIEKIACDKFNHDFEIQSNGNYILVQSKKSQDLSDMSYFVYSVKDKHIIIEDSLKQGEIIWSDKYSILASEKDDQLNSDARKYKFNVKKRKYHFL